MVGNTNIGCNLAYSHLYLGDKQIMKIIIQGIELNLIALWLDVALFEGWNEVTPYVVCWGFREKEGNHQWDGARYYSNIFSAKADWREKSEIWDILSIS